MTTLGTVVVVGLGPGEPGLLTEGARAAIASTGTRFLRTVDHPSAHLVGEARAFDYLYERADDFDEVYSSIVEALVAAASDEGRVLYAVPGSPGVLERSVAMLVADDRVDVEVIAGMSFVDLAWVRIGIDPVEAGVRLVDGHTFAVSAAGERGPLLVAHCHNRRVLSDIKLAVDAQPETEVVVLQRLGLPDEAVFTISWADLDRAFQPDHLTSIYIPALSSSAGSELIRFEELVRTLRAECPWDRSQTHQSLRRHLVEEAYEVIDAIDGFDAETGAGAAELESELGDLLFQVFLHSVMAAEEGWFEIADVARSIHDKLHARHPHVFGAETTSTEALSVSWELSKKTEMGRSSVMDGVARRLPSLSLAEKVLKKSAVVRAPLGLDETMEIAACLDAFGRQPSPSSLGRALLAMVSLARGQGLDAEMALREHTRALADRVRRYEHLAAESDIDVISAEGQLIAEIWRDSQ